MITLRYVYLLQCLINVKSSSLFAFFSTDVLCRVFVFLHFLILTGENTTHKMCRPFAFNLSYLLSRVQNPKLRKHNKLELYLVLKLLYCYIFTFSFLWFCELLHCYMFALSRSVCTCASSNQYWLTIVITIVSFYSIVI